jgi:hypothetical protein
MTLQNFIPAVVAGLLFVTPTVVACPFCAPMGQTLSGEVAQADFILYGTLTKAVRDPNDPTALNKGTTEMTIDLVVKPHDLIKGKKSITIPRYVPPDSKDLKYLIFFNVVNGQIDAYRGEAVPADSKLPQYLEGAIKVRDKDPVTRLRYFFDYLEDKDLLISSDAYSEFGYTDYKDVRELAPKLPPAILLKWLKDPDTRGTRVGLYGLLLGHCGKAEDAKALRQLLDDPERAFSSGLDGLVAGYILLNPQAGWDYLLTLIKDPNQDFPVRYSALKTVRFFWEYRSDIIGKDQVLEAMKILCENPDIADMPIEDLRKWKVWSLTPLVLNYGTKPSHNSIPIVRRAILKFAIAAATADPNNKAALEYVATARAKDPRGVEFLEEVLKEELKPTEPAKKIK